MRVVLPANGFVFLPIHFCNLQSQADDTTFSVTPNEYSGVFSPTAVC